MKTNSNDSNHDPEAVWGIWIDSNGGYFHKNEKGIYYFSTDPDQVLEWIKNFKLKDANIRQMQEYLA